DAADTSWQAACGAFRSCARCATPTSSPCAPTRCTATARAPSPRPAASAPCWTKRASARASGQGNLPGKAERAPGKRVHRVAVRGDGAAHRVRVVARVEEIVHREREAHLLDPLRDLQV